MLNRSELASPLGVSVPTISEWLAILEITSQVLLLPPFFENFGKRLLKTPKLYFVDPGLLCHLLGIDSAAMKGYATRSLLVHRSGREKPATTALSGGASAVPASELAGALGPRQRPP